MERSVEPEWLDQLPADDPRAIRSRGDLMRVNRVMGHAAHIRRALAEQCATPSPRIAEIGAGDATLMLRVLGKHPQRATLVFVDRQPVVSAATLARYRERGHDADIAAADVFDWLKRQTRPYDLIVANLFLHHFEAPRLRELLTLASRCTKSLIACEPLRARVPLAGSRMLRLLGCNDVTLHDAALSVRAGFTGSELSELWPASGGWTLQERRAGLFSHLFVASSGRDA